MVTRWLDCEPRADSVWHELGQALRSQDVEVELPFGARVELRESRPPTILLNDAPLPRPRIAKS